MNRYAGTTLTPAWVLHRRPYSNTSLLVDFFTLNFGRTTCVARGVRKKGSRLAAIVQPFIPLVITVSGRGAVKTLGTCEPVDSYQALQGERLYSAYYLNELVLKALQATEPHAPLFAIYAEVLGELASGHEDTEVLLRKFELHLLAELGYGLQLDHDVKNGVPIQGNKRYRYDHAAGATEVTGGVQIQPSVPLISGECLLALKEFRLTEKRHLCEAKILMRYLINNLLGGYHFKSRDFFTNRTREKHDSNI